MKAVLTLLLVLFFGVAALAQDAKSESKVEVVAIGIATTNTNEDASISFDGISLKNENSVARLYMFKNSRVKKELSFTTKRHKSK